MEKRNLDFQEMIRASADVRAMLKKTKKIPTSLKPLKFEVLEGDSPLKQTIIERINASNKTYSDLYKYCSDLKGGDVDAGTKAAANLINGLKNRHTFIDTTLTLLADFLDLDILFVDRKKAESDDDDMEDYEDQEWK